MTPAVLADTLNLTHQIKTYGAYAGFAAIIGLAVLSVLYFAQAREVKRLREWAGRGPERAAEVGARAGADANRRIVAEPMARPEPVTAAAQSSPPPAKTGPATLAAVGAVGAATASSGDKNGDDDKPDVDVAAGDEVVEAENGAKAQDSADAEATSIVKPDNKPSDDKDAADAKSSGDTEDDIGQTSVAMAPIPASARARASASPTPARRPRTGTPPPVDEDPDDGHSPWPMRLLIGAGVIVLVVFVLVVISPFGGGDDKKAASTPVTSHGTPTAVTTGAVKGGSVADAPPRSQIKVGVLNGTLVFNLAKTTGNKLSGAGFNVPPESETNASDQTHAATTVAYAPGQKSSALAVARTLGLARDSLVPLDPDTKLVAQSALPSGQSLNVVVTVGADLDR